MRILGIILLIVGVSGCSRGPSITVANGSASTLSNLVVIGSGFTNALGSLVPGERRVIHVHPHGESGVRLVFDVAGSRHDSGETGYFEDSSLYAVAVTVSADLAVRTKDSLRRY